MRTPLVFALGLLALSCSKKDRAKQAEEGAPEDAAPASTASTDAPEIMEVADLQAAARWLMKRETPLVIGVGEYHQIAGGPPVTSALHRFTEEMFDILAERGSSLVLETWVPAENCAVAEKVEGDIQQTIQRPEATESEMDRLLARSAARNMSRLALPLLCADYEHILGEEGVDFDKLLQLLGERLYQQIEKGFRSRRSADMTVIAYGGSLHNDRYPYEGVEAYSYAQRALKLAAGRYLEIDLYVPELIENDELLQGEGWFPEFQKRSSEDRVLIVRRGEGSYILVLRKNRRAQDGADGGNAPDSPGQ